MTSDDVLLPRAEDGDACPAADVWLRAFAAALPTVRCAHGEAELHATEPWPAPSARRGRQARPVTRVQGP